MIVWATYQVNEMVISDKLQRNDAIRNIQLTTTFAITKNKWNYSLYHRITKEQQAKNSLYIQIQISYVFSNIDVEVV